MAKRIRSWFWTLNNYNQDDIHTYTEKLENHEYVFQEEKGAKGTPHLQGCVRFKNGKSFEAVKKILGDRAHIQVCKNWKHSKKYCCKENTRNGAIYTNLERNVEDKIPEEMNDRMVDLMVNRFLADNPRPFRYSETIDPPPISDRE